MVFLIWILVGIATAATVGYVFYSKEGKITVAQLPMCLVIILFGPIAALLAGAMGLGLLYEKYEDVVLLSKEEEEE